MGKLLHLELGPKGQIRKVRPTSKPFLSNLLSLPFFLDFAAVPFLYLFLFSAMAQTPETSERFTPSYHVVFEEIGKMASSLSFLHLRIPLNISILEETLLTLLDHYDYLEEIIKHEVHVSDQKSRDDYLYDYDKQFWTTQTILTNFSANLISAHKIFANNSLQKLYNLDALLPNIEYNSEAVIESPQTLRGTRYRNRRFIPLLMQGLGTIGTFMGLFSGTQLHSLKTRLNDLTSVTNQLVEDVRVIKTNINDLANKVTSITEHLTVSSLSNPILLDAPLRNVKSLIDIQISTIYDVLQMAQQRRLSLRMFDTAQLHSLMHIINRKAAEFKLEPLVKKPSDLLQLEVSYFFNGEIVSLLLHVPAISPNSLLTLHTMHPFPLPLSEKYALMPDVEGQILAVAPGHHAPLSTTLTQAELLNCQNLNGVYLCEGKGILNRNIEQTCLGTLFQSKFERAKHLCRMQVVEPSERVYRIRETEYLVYSTQPQTASVVCLKENPADSEGSTRRLVTGVNRIRVQPGCVVELLHHQIRTDFSISAEVKFHHTEIKNRYEIHIPSIPEALNNDLAALTHLGMMRPTIAELNRIVNHLRNKTSTPFQFQSLFSAQAPDLELPPLPDFVSFETKMMHEMIEFVWWYIKRIILAVVIITIIIVIIIVFNFANIVRFLAATRAGFASRATMIQAFQFLVNMMNNPILKEPAKLTNNNPVVPSAP